MKTINSIELIDTLRLYGFQVDPRDTLELDLILNAMYKAGCNMKSITQQAVGLVMSKVKEPSLSHLIKLLYSAKNLSTILAGISDKAKEENERFEKVLEELGYERID